MTDKTIREKIVEILNDAYDAKPDIEGSSLYEVFMKPDTPELILAIREIKEGQELLEKAKSGKERLITVDELAKTAYLAGEPDADSALWDREANSIRKKWLGVAAAIRRVL